MPTSDQPFRAPYRWEALERRPALALIFALALVAVIGYADSHSGYELRLSVLYLVPIAVATWTAGRPLGIAIALLGPMTWAATFGSEHRYSHDAYFYWECIVMAGTFVLFSELLARLHAALSAADQRFVRVLDGLHAAVYVTDDDGRVLFANRHLARMLGPDASRATAATITARFPETGGKAPVDDTSSHLPFTGAQARDSVDGRWYVIQAGTIPWVGPRHARLTLMTDVTEQKRAEALQREHQAAMHHTARLVGLAETAATLAHELNQPLLAIVGYNSACLRLLKEGRADATELAQAMEKCRAQAVRAGEIIHRVRELARRRTPALVSCDVNAVVSETLRSLAPEAERAGVNVEVALRDGIPRAQADAILIGQVVANLVQNAIDAVRAEPPPSRRIRVSTGLEPEGGVRVTIADEGPGLDASVEDRLYAPFVTTKANGLGLGLSICRSIVELHGGRIGHEAAAPRGTRFHFTLPEET